MMLDWVQLAVIHPALRKQDLFKNLRQTLPVCGILTSCYLFKYYNKGHIKMFEIPVGARHLLIQETDATSHNLGKYVTSRKIFSQNIFFLLFIFVSGA